MKIRGKYFALVFSLVTMVGMLFANSAIAINNEQGYTTTIIDSDGLKIEVGDIKEASTVSFEDYLKENIDTTYANLEKFEIKDAIYVKHILAEDSKLPEEKTIDAMYDAGAEAFILMNDLGTYLYDVDENSDYYVAFVDTMHDDSSSYVADYSFAYTNLNGEVITDAIYDFNTGLAYVPKKYTAENKNGAGVLNVQVELLQAVDSQNPVTTFDAKVTVDENIKGTFATEGIVSVKSLTAEFGVRVALDKEAIENINRRYIRVKINDTDVTDFVYYHDSGIIVFSNFPATVDTMEISISEDNVAINESEVDETTLSAVTYAEMETLGYAGVWTVDGDVQEGQLITIKGQDVVQDVYLAGEFHLDGYPMYNVSSDVEWTELTGKVLNGGNIDLDNLSRSGSWIQHLVRIIDEVTVDAGNGATITIPNGINWYLKCVHNATTFTTFNERVPNENGEGYPRDRAYEIRMRVLKVTDDYIIMGMLTSSLHTQAGTGIFKIEIDGGKGSLKLGKKDDYGNFVPGAKFSISGPDGYYNEIITTEGPTQIDDLKKGDYTIREMEAPNKFIKTNEEYQKEVKTKEVTECWIPNYYQRGTVTLIKTDGDDKIEGSPRLDGAVFKLCAAEDIWEGNHKVYSANEVIDSNIVTNVDGTTKVFENMPIGKYYYEEVSNPYGYYKKDGHFDVEVKYQGQDSPNATDETAICKEDQTYNDITIIKKIEETSNYPERILEGAEFTATLVHRADDYNQDPVVGVSVYEGNGVYKIKHLPVGDYVVEETVVPEKTFKSKNFNVTIDEGDQDHGPYSLDEENAETGFGFINIKGELVDTSIKMVIKIRKVDYDRTDDQAIDWTQGDAQLQGAIYRIFEYNEDTNAYDKVVYDITVNKKDTDGCWYAESGKLLVGKYMVKEQVKYTEVKDGVTYEHSYAEGYLVDPNPYYFEQDVVAHDDTEEVTHYHKTSKEKVQRGAVYVKKYDDDRSNVDAENDSDKVPSAGAVLRLTLDSNPSIYYTVKLDNNGYGEFLEKNDSTHKSTAAHESYDTYKPYTIPYGKYTITEDKEADSGENTSFYLQPEPVTVSKQADKQYRIEADEPVPVWLKVIKRDKSTGNEVGLPGAKFKIWDIKAERWVSMKIGVGIYVEEFETNDDGYFYSPQKLYPGEYVVYESCAPKGYYLQDDWRIPTDTKDLGNSQVSGKYVKIDKIATGLTADEVYPGGIEVGELVYETSMPDNPLYINIRIEKTAEKLTGVSEDTVTYEKSGEGEVQLDVTRPKYTPNIGLAGVKYQIYANEDIYTPDNVKRASKDELMKDKNGKDYIETNSEGIAQSWDLFPGSYKIVEIEVPDGYLIDPTPKYIKAENENQYVKSATATLELSDVRQKLKYTFKKVFETGKYVAEDEQKFAVFGVYTRQAINDYKGNLLIPADTLVDVLMVTDNNFVSTATDFPEGKYYLKEIYATFPFSVSEEIKDFELKYNGDGETEEVEYKGDEFINTEIPGYARFVKLSKSTVDDVILNGSELDTSELDAQASEILEKMQGMSIEEIEKYFEDEDVKVVEGAVYEVWLDAEGTRKLLEIDEGTGDKRVAKFTTNKVGVLELALPKRAYYLKEVSAPAGYEIQNEVIPFTITNSNPEVMLYQAIYDGPVINPFLHKSDFFTGEDVAKCTFEITDDKGKLLAKLVTDEDGLAWIPNDTFEKYRDKPDTKFYYTELDAPSVYKDDGKLYVLNTEPHEFTGHYDEVTGLFTVELKEVENLRPLTDVTLIKTDEEDNLVPNCKFELKSEEENLFYETGVTDENGIYVFKNVPQGWYTYTELEAPEEYDLDTTPHRIYVTGDEMIIEFVNTGDIPVVAIACLAALCLAGVAFITVRKVKLAKNN